MLKNLPENILMNISSFLIGTPQQLRLHNNKKFKQIQKQFQIEYEKPMIFDYDPSKIEMTYYIKGSRLNPAILQKQENTISNFIENFIYKNYDGECYFEIAFDITFYYCKIVKTCASFGDYDVYRGGGYLRRLISRYVPFHLERCIEQFRREIEKQKRWQKKDTDIRKFKTEDFRINVEIKKIYDGNSD